MTRAVAVTGVGAVTPLGDASELLRRWSAGESGIVDGLGACREFEPTTVLTKKEARRADRFTQLAIAAAEQALAAAGWDRGLPYPPERIACVIGTGIGGIGTIEEQHDVLNAAGAQRVSPLSVPLMMGNAAAAALSMRYGLHGQAATTVSACAAGSDAIGMALRLLRGGEADAVVTGGAEAALTPLSRAAFGSMEATSPSGISRPFDARRDGFVMGEGAGILVLEDAEAALRRNAQVHGQVLGYGASADAYHITAPEPTGAGAAMAIRRALENAGVAPEELVYINAHGTSTPLNDRVETDAIKRALGPIAERLPVSSTKSAIGHLLGAAGAVEAIVTLLALREGIVPPTLGYEEPEQGLDLDYVPDLGRKLSLNGHPRAIAISNSFGFGGHNAVICLAA